MKRIPYLYQVAARMSRCQYTLKLECCIDFLTLAIEWSARELPGEHASGDGGSESSEGDSDLDHC